MHEVGCLKHISFSEGVARSWKQPTSPCHRPLSLSSSAIQYTIRFRNLLDAPLSRGMTRNSRRFHSLEIASAQRITGASDHQQDREQDGHGIMSVFDALPAIMIQIHCDTSRDERWISGDEPCIA